MTTVLLVIFIIYFLIGLIIYAVTDTTAFASRMESILIVVPHGVLQKYIFLFVAVLWPFWLVIRFSSAK